MNGSGGTIELDSRIDNTGMEKGVNNIDKSLKKIDNSLSNTSKKISDTFTGNQSKIDSLTSRIERQEQAIDKETVKLERLKQQYNSLLSGESTPKSLINMETELKKVEKEYNNLTAKSKELYNQLQLEKSYDISIRDNGKISQLESELKQLDNQILTTGERSDYLNAQIDKIKLDPTTSEEAQKLSESIGLTSNNVARLNNDLSRTKTQMNSAMGKETISQIRNVKKETEKTNGSIERLWTRLKRIAIGALIFNAISVALTQLRKYMGELLATNKQFTESMNRVKTGLAVAFQPIYEAIVPILTNFMNLLAKVVTYIAYFTNALFGKTISQSKKNAEALNKQAEALKNAGSSADSASKSLFAFDKANVLQDKSKSGGSGLSDIIGNTDLPEINTKPLDVFKSKLEELLVWLDKNFGGVWKRFWSGLKINVGGLINNGKKLFSGLKPIWADFLDFLKNKWVPDFAGVLGNIGDIFNGLFDSLNLVIGSLIDVVLLPFLDVLVNQVFPILSDLSSKLFEALGNTFLEIKLIFDTVWIQGIIPVLQLMSQIWEDMWVALDEFWNKWGAPIFANINEAVKNTGDIIMSLWNNILKPIWDNITRLAKEIWDSSLKPLFKNILDTIGELINGALSIYNKFISPIVKWLVENLGPAFSKTFNTIANIVGTVIKGIIGAINGIVTALKGIIQFLTGVFTGDWGKAWSGIKNVTKGIFDSLVSLFKVPINLIIDGLNKFIKALNKIQIPDWVPGVGGKGFNFATIPRLATGAVIPPNEEFLAVLGDQKRGNNIETPEALLRKVVREESGKGSSDGSVTEIRVYVGDDEVEAKVQKVTKRKQFLTNGG